MRYLSLCLILLIATTCIFAAQENAKTAQKKTSKEQTTDSDEDVHLKVKKIFDKYDPEEKKVYPKHVYGAILYELMTLNAGQEEISSEYKKIIKFALLKWVRRIRKPELTFDELIRDMDSQELKSFIRETINSKDIIVEDQNDEL